jgi:hypothetical protein
MKTQIFILLFISALFSAQKNVLEINGWTNINTFKCVENQFKGSAMVYSFTGAQLPNIAFKITNFDCGNKVMTGDFQKTLKADKFPELTIKFLQFKKTSSNTFQAVVDVKMMTVSRKYPIEFTYFQNSLMGNKRLKFSDFQIVPPKKMGGMVYVKDELDLVFSLKTND